MKLHTLIILVSVILLSSWKPFDKSWISEKHNNYTLLFTSIDRKNIKEYNRLVENGINSVKEFFSSPYKKQFKIFIHPNRMSLDTTWQKDFKLPGFKSECWMVASGDAGKLDMISPKLWDKLSCEHIYSETTHTQQLITHELVHVYHAQYGVDYNNVEGLDWFVEGLATYASGQCDTLRIAEVKKAVNNNKIPKVLDDFWTGKIKYGLSGSVVMYIDHKYGRIKLKELLLVNKKSEVLSLLNTTEAGLLGEWRKYIQNL
jgi:hypothetical protein